MQLSDSNGKSAVQAPAGKQSGQLQPLHRVIRGHHPGRVPDICAAPVTSSTGQAALVSDVYQEWFAVRRLRSPQDVSVLFGNANGPGNPLVQAIFKALPDGPTNLARDIDSTVTADPRW